MLSNGDDIISGHVKQPLTPSEKSPSSTARSPGNREVIGLSNRHIIFVYQMSSTSEVQCASIVTFLYNNNDNMLLAHNVKLK